MDTRQIILIVDDQAENLAVLGDLLETHYRVRVANSGEHALRAAASDPKPDLILLDVMMPEMDGYAVLARLRNNAATRDIPVIFVTAKDSATDEEHGLEMGAADYITKPIKPVVVLARVRTQLENKQAKDWLKDQNRFLEAEIQRRMHDNELVQNASLHALAILAETRDKDTGRHIHRTQAYVEALAKYLESRIEYAEELAGGQLLMIVKAAPLHDIGKVGIPDHILNKPARFNADEYAIIQTHSRIGGDSIALAIERVKEAHATAPSREPPLKFLDVARQIAMWHHERWDGLGYPDKLSGRNIPLAARIMALADVFDALVSKRIYKNPVPMDDAIKIIRTERAQHFDPGIVDAFLDVQDEFTHIARHFADA